MRCFFVVDLSLSSRSAMRAESMAAASTCLLGFRAGPAAPPFIPALTRAAAWPKSWASSFLPTFCGSRSPAARSAALCDWVYVAEPVTAW